LKALIHSYAAAAKCADLAPFRERTNQVNHLDSRFKDLHSSLPQPEPERRGPSVNFILSMPDGTKRETTNFNEVQEMVWPTRETQETPAEPSEFGSAQDANREDDGFAP
jgi:hypothetical protein